MKGTLVRYRVKEGQVAANEEAIRAVFAELQGQAPSGVRYASVRLEDGTTFVHLFSSEEGAAPLSSLSSFAAFRAGLRERCEEPPVIQAVEVIGAYPRAEARRIYVVTAATGNIGGRVARGLLGAGHRVRAVGRSAERLAPLAALGAEPWVGDVRDAAFVEEAMRGADAALLVGPPDHGARDVRRYFGDVGQNYAAAAQATGLRAAVFISCIGSHDERYRGFILIHNDVERSLDAVPGLDVLHVRAPSFFENLLYFLPAMQARGVLSTPIDPDVPFETAATADVADIALRRLRDLDFRGKGAVEVHGPRPLTIRDMAAAIERELGRPFPAERADRDADIEHLVAGGASRDFAALLNDTWDVFSRHGVIRAQEPSADTRGRTSIEDFVRSQLIGALHA